jgi:thiamine transport system substrate-binding protein
MKLTYHRSTRRRLAALSALVVGAVLLAGCSSGSTGAGSADTSGAGSSPSAAASSVAPASSGTDTAGALTTGTTTPGSNTAGSNAADTTPGSNTAGSTSAGSPSSSAGSSTSAEPSGPAGSATSASQSATGTVTLVTHDSFAVDKKTLQDFEAASGITVKLLAQGDVGEMVSKLILTKDNPLGDAVFGIDNTFASKALDAGVLQPYQSPAAVDGSNAYAIDPQHRLTAIDYGDVCVNVDHTYFADKHLAEPATFEDLAKPAYKNMLVVESPETSSPGLAFLLGTIAHFGDNKWQDYWKSLQNNGVKVDSGWTDAYSVDFSGSTGKGDYPLVVSYASSPPDEVTAGMTSAPTGALLDTCFRQIEYAGVLAGAKNPAAAQKVVDFLLSKQFQAGVPEQMYVYPVDKGTPLPADWQKYAPVAPNPATLDPTTIAKNRDTWTSQWADLMGQ